MRICLSCCIIRYQACICMSQLHNNSYVSGKNLYQTMSRWWQSLIYYSLNVSCPSVSGIFFWCAGGEKPHKNPVFENCSFNTGVVHKALQFCHYFFLQKWLIQYIHLIVHLWFFLSKRESIFNVLGFFSFDWHRHIFILIHFKADSAKCSFWLC